MRDPSSVPKGLVFFSPRTPRSYRRRRIVFSVIYGIAFVSLLWPVAALAAGPRPLVLGIPPALAWVLLWLVVLFFTLLWLYRSEPDEAPPDPPEQQ